MSLLAAIGIPVPAWAVEIVAVVALLGSGALYFEHKGKEIEIDYLKAESQELIKSAEGQIKSINERHAAEVAANQEKLNAATAANNALADQLDQRVRDFDAYRRAHPAVASTPGVAGPARSGECGAFDCGELAVRLASTGDELARSNGLLVASLQSCQRDRDSLTGL